MIMKRIYYLFITLIFFATSCSSNDDPGVGIVDPYHYSFTPRDVNYIWAVPFSHNNDFTVFSIEIATYNQNANGIIYADHNPIFAKLWKNVDRPIPEIEADIKKHYPYIIGYVPIEQNFEYDLRLWKGLGAVIEPGYEEIFCGHCMEYRTEGIESLKISADRPLFGEEAGASLNKYFITELGDKFYNLAYPSYSNIPFAELSCKQEGFERCIGDIDRWIAYHPVAYPSMRVLTLEPLTESEINNTIWTFEMTTTAGKYFKVSHRAIAKLSEGEKEYFPYLPEFMSEATLVK